MTADPSGLFQRIPELEPLCQETRIRKAVEGGDPLKVYRALWWARTLNRLPGQREVLKSLLSQRRLFARPIQKAPSLYTFNSVGTAILGKSEQSADGTYIATHCFVMLFAIPLLPLGAYVVAPGQKARSYSFFARVPLGFLAWAWSRLWAFAVVAAVAFGAVRAGYSVGHHELQIVNAFDKPVQVQIGEQRATVPAQGRLPLTLPVGKFKGQAHVAGVAAPIDETDLDIVSNNSLLIWNVAGAAPVYLEPVIYDSDASAKHAESKPTVYCGQRFISLQHVDDAFSDSPKEVQMSESEKQTTRIHVDVVGQAKTSSAICFGWLGSQDKLAQAMEIQATTARAEGWKAEIAVPLLGMETVADPALADRLAREADAAHPDDLNLQRAVQDARVSAGHEAEVVADYRKRAAASPDSAAAQYLYARLLDGPAGIQASEQLLKRFPRDVAALRLAVYERAAAGEWADSDHAWQALQTAQPEEAVGQLEIDALDLVALGRAKEAEARVDAAFSHLEPASRERQDVAALHARLALLSGEADPDRLLKQTETEDAPATLLRARLGLPFTHTKDEEPVVQVAHAIRTAPAEAVAASAKIALFDLPGLDPITWALAFAEATRTRAEAAEQSLGRYYPFVLKSEVELLRRFVRAENVSLPKAFLDPTVRAAALFVRSRNPSLPAKERAALVAEARRLDWLHTQVSSAIDSWPPPTAAR